MESRAIVIEGKHIGIGYRSHKERTMIHNDLNFKLYQGELTCLLGSNGSGKSTLLRTLSAIQPTMHGNIQLLGKPLNEYTEKERSRTIGVVLTEKTQAGGLSVYELVSLGRQPHTGFFGRLNSYDKELINHALQAVGIADLKNKYVAELSDGERQKSFIAKALVQECPLILLDEPTAFLDVVSRIDIMLLLRKLAIEEKRAILLSTHDIDQALLLADRLWLLHRNEGLRCGVTEDLIYAHEMNHLFPQDHIYFDVRNGIYSPKNKYEHTIQLQAADKTLYHWAQNALNRIGFYCIEADKNTAEFPILNAASPHSLILTENGSTCEFTNFESLLQVLKK